MVGAGTAITVGLAKKALEAGAQFLLTPGTPLDVMEYCKKNRVKLLPSVLTPSEVAVSLEYGYQTMKLFPAGNMPLNYVKSLKGPFDRAEFVAIGGRITGELQEVSGFRISGGWNGQQSDAQRGSGKGGLEGLCHFGPQDRGRTQ